MREVRRSKIDTMGQKRVMTDRKYYSKERGVEGIEK
jgi:hypothetical protein